MMSRRFFLVLFLLFGVLLGLPTATLAGSDPLSPSQFRLSNGLQVVFMARPGTPLVEQRMVVDAGFFDVGECPLMELPHLVEHLVFMGTERDSEADLDRQMTALGGKWNASTSTYQTVYEMSVPQPNVEKGLALLAHILADARFDDDTVERAREVVYREDGGKDSWWYAQLQRLGMDRSAWDRFYGASFGEDWNCPGPADYSAITARDALAFIDRHYSLDNMTLVVVGDLDGAALKSMLERVYGAFPQRQGGSREIPVQQQPVDQKQFVGWYLPNAEPDTMVTLLFPALDTWSADKMALRWLEAYVSDILFERLRVQHALAYTPRAYTSPSRFYGFFELSAMVKPEDEARAVELLRQVMAELRGHQLDAERLAQTREVLINQYKERFQSNEDYAEFYAWNEPYRRRDGVYRDFPGELQVQQVADVYRVIDTWLGPEHEYLLLDRTLLSWGDLGLCGGGVLVLGFGVGLRGRRRRQRPGMLMSRGDV